MSKIQKETMEAIFATVREAGKIMSEAYGGGLRSGEISDKEGTANFVTVYDVRVQNMLTQALSEILPKAKFLAEEKENDLRALQKGYVFVIDPIDGTTNFIHDLRASCISVALYYDGEAEFGTVYDPYHDELFHAVRGGGAFCNGTPIRVSNRAPETAVWAVGTSPYLKAHHTKQTFASLEYLFLHGADLRRIGAAALDLAWVAAGRMDGFFEWFLSPWDYGAGSLLIREAGGVIETIGEADITPRFDRGSGIIAGSPCVMPTLRAAAEAAKGVTTE